MTFISRLCRLAAIAAVGAFLTLTWLASGPGTRTAAPAISVPAATAAHSQPAATAAHSQPAAPEDRRAAAHVMSPASYSVRSGDTLSSIAAAHGKSVATLEAANPQVGNPDLIYPGQRVSLSGGSGAVFKSAVRRTSSGPGAYGHPYRCGDGDGDGWDMPCHHTATPRRHHRAATAGAASHVSSAGSSFERCVIQRESGGNAQVMNGSGHYGLFQFDLTTWESGGGSASSFGHAPAAEQERVFSSVYALRGTQPWAPYDHC